MYRVLKGIRRTLTTAPELIQSNDIFLNGTQKGDVYSFGFLLFEIYARRGPFGIGHVFDLNSITIYKEIIEKLRNPQMHIRPNINTFKAPDCVKATISQCWHKDPDERPDMRTIRMKLKELLWGL